MERIPKEIYLDMQELIDCGYLSETTKNDELATKYISVERLWHNRDEEPFDQAQVLVRFSELSNAPTKVVACQYDSEIGMFFCESGHYSFNNIVQWAYIEDIL